MLEFYGLREHPFGVSPNPRYLYPSVQHREALASLLFGIENKVGFAALIAEPGTGKTTLLFDVLMRFRERASTAFVFNTQCNGQELLRHILMELQVPGGDFELDPIRQHQLFTSFVADCQRTKPVVIVIDEAQHLDDSAMEALRLLSNFEAADHKLLHIILAGQPQLGEKLRLETHTQLLQRITIISRLGRFSPEQTEECIAFRLRVAGYSGPPLFSDEALAKIRTASYGVPREINRICLNAVYLGFALRQKQIGAEVIDEVLADLDLNCEPRTSRLGDHQGAESKINGVEPKAFSPSVIAEISNTQNFNSPVIAQELSTPAVSHAANVPVISQALSTPTVPKTVSTPVVPRTSSAPVVPHSPSTPVVPKAFSAERLKASAAQIQARKPHTADAEAASTVDEPKITRIFDEWQTNTPIDPSAGAFRLELPSTAIPAPKTERNVAKPKIEKMQAAKPNKREPLKVRFAKRVAIIFSLCGAAVISALLFGLNSSIWHEPSVTASNPPIASNPPMTQTLPPAEPEVAQSVLVKPQMKSAPLRPKAASGSVISVGPVIGNGESTPSPGGGDDASSSGSSLYRSAVLEKFVRPSYPTAAKRMHIEGDVVLKLNIASDGSVQGIRILSGNSVLARAATEAVQQWRYQPAHLNGSPVSAEAKTVLTFRVDDDNN